MAISLPATATSMADTLPFSSQASEGNENSSPVQGHLVSSPLRAQSKARTISSDNKIKKPPTVTPKRFTKFFTPRNTTGKSLKRSRAGQQLRDITRNGANRRRIATDSSADPFNTIEHPSSPERPPKRQRYSTTDLISSPPQSSPLKHVQIREQIRIFEDDAPLSPILSDNESLPDLPCSDHSLPPPIRRLSETGSSRRLLARSFGGHNALGYGFRGSDHACDFRSETANFVTLPHERHDFDAPALPFCITSCNTNSLVAAGDEEGTIRIMDSSPSSKFDEPYLKFRVHHNAIMDVGFSSDDMCLATASGDQTAAIVDMQTQLTICVLLGHTGTVKQVRFKPGDDNIITTSSRDGTVQLWDSRCSGKSAVQSLRTSFARGLDAVDDWQPETRYGQQLDVGNSHRTTQRPFDLNRPDLSITSFQHLPQGSGHLIVTASEASATIKVWDIRNAQRRNPVALSSTATPDSHRRIRNFGINSMVLSGDGARLYAVCRDSTVYAYSTNHLVLGDVPEMSYDVSRRRTLKELNSGIAPLYGFRHSSLRVGTFYVKAALRPARDDKSEVLAVGSSEHGPVLFPTDERYFLRQPHSSGSTSSPSSPSSKLPPLTPEPPIYQHGTLLIRGHAMEATSLTWTQDGSLVSLGDDYVARCWRENSTKARELRAAGESGGVRWRHGWADVAADWDDEDC